MKYTINTTIEFKNREQKHCIDCPLRDHYDSCALQDDKDFFDWEEQMKGCPLVEVTDNEIHNLFTTHHQKE